MQKSAQDTPRFVSKLTVAAAKVGRTKAEVRSALGPPHDEGVDYGEHWWLYHFDEKPSHYMRIAWDKSDKVAKVDHIH
jgi:outer membrane protein assembly factor BamE (lipoprotein component of BamABCDE complex)